MDITSRLPFVRIALSSHNTGNIVFMMSGFEVIGVVLGIVPLIISATKCYNTTLRSLKNVQANRGLLEADLLVEKNLFFNEIFILLKRATNWEDAEVSVQMELGNESNRMNAEVEEKVQKYLGTSFDSVTVTMRAILEHLKYFEQETKKFWRQDMRVSNLTSLQNMPQFLLSSS